MPRLLFLGLLLFSSMAFGQASLQGIIINEILVNPNGSANNDFDTDGDGNIESVDEFIELYNSTSSPVNLDGWSLQDEGSGEWFTFPNISIPANGFLVVVTGFTGTDLLVFFA